jgi:hypothetical protein
MKVNGGITKMFLQDQLDVVNIGRWLIPSWPSIADIQLGGGDTPILIWPAPNYFEDLYPMPVSIFQDIQQEDFWSVGVPSFGHSLFYLKALTQGTRVNYTVIRDAYGNIYNWNFASGKAI